MRTHLLSMALACALFAAAWPAELPAAKRALLIGINDYLYGPDHWDLRGCVNDVEMTRRTLQTRLGFPSENIKVLLNEEATAKNIVGAIEDWLIAGSAPEDVVYLHFSGHGSRISDRDGDEEDGWDELLCPADLVPNDRTTMLIDDQLRQLLDRIPARNVTVVLDACHSGTGPRDVSLSRPRSIDLDAPRTRGLNPTSNAQTILTAFQGGSIAAKPGQGMEMGRAARQHRVTISDCKPDQTSADAWIRDGLYAGALTYNLLQNIDRAAADVTYRELMERVRRDMAGKYYQTPQIEGDIDLPVFDTGASSAPGATEAVIHSIDGDIIRLNIGWSHGVTPGSVYAVYSPNATELIGPGIALLQIAQVGDTTSEARLTQGSHVVPGSRVKQALHSFIPAPLNLRVEAESALRQGLVQGLTRVPFVEVVPPDRHFDLRLIANRGAGGITGSLVFDGVPRTQESGSSTDHLIDKLRPHLGGAYVAKRLTALSNPAADFEVSVWANRVSTSGYASNPQALDAMPAERLVQARIGDVIRLNFRAQRDCYLTVINVGTSGRVTVLFPNEHRPDGWIRGGRVYQTETEGEMPFKIRAVGPPGRELVKAVATLEPIELASLQMGTLGASGTRSIESGGEFTEQLARDMAAVPVAGNVALTAVLADPVSGPLLPTSGWATDYIIIDTRE